MPNRLLERLGEGAVSALFDEFVWPDAGGGEGCEAAGDTRAAVHGCSADGGTTASGTADGGTTAGGAADGGAAGGYGTGGGAATNSAAQLPALRNLLVHGRLQLEEVRPEAVLVLLRLAVGLVGLVALGDGGDASAAAAAAAWHAPLEIEEIDEIDEIDEIEGGDRNLAGLRSHGDRDLAREQAERLRVCLGLKLGLGLGHCEQP